MARFEPFWDVICDFSHYLWLGVMFSVFLLILSVISLVFATPGSSSHALAIFNLVIVLVMGSTMILMFRVCAKRQTKRF